MQEQPRDLFSYLSRKPLLAGLISGLLFGLSFTPFPFFTLIFIAFIPLLSVFQQTDHLSDVFKSSFVAFTLWHIIVMRSSFIIDFGLSAKFFLLGLYMIYALFMCLPLMLAFFLKQKSSLLYALIALPFFWTTYEIIHNWGVLSINVVNLHFALTKFPFLVQLTELIGLRGSSLIIITLNILLFLSLNGKQEKRRTFRFALLGLLIVFFGLNGILWLNDEEENVKEIKIGMIQPDFDPYAEIDAREMGKRLNSLFFLTKKLKAEKPNLIVWHETAIQGIQVRINDIDSNDVIKKLKSLSSEIKAPILTGLIAYELYENKDYASKTARPINDGSERYFDIYNSAILVQSDQPTQIYYKNRMVPFVESVPFLSQIPFLESFQIQVGNEYPSYAMKENAALLEFDDYKIATAICFEGVYPSYVKQMVNKGANLIVLITNEGWTGNSASVEQLADCTSTLSAHFNMPVCRVANNGKSLVTDSKGQFIKSTEYGTQKSFTSIIQVANKKTFFSSNGSYINNIIMLVSLLLFGRIALKNLNIPLINKLNKRLP